MLPTSTTPIIALIKGEVNMKQSFELLKEILEGQKGKVFYTEFYYKDSGDGATLSFGFEPDQITVDEIDSDEKIINILEENLLLSFSDKVYSWWLFKSHLFFLSKEDSDTYWIIEFL